MQFIIAYSCQTYCQRNVKLNSFRVKLKLILRGVPTHIFSYLYLVALWFIPVAERWSARVWPGAYREWGPGGPNDRCISSHLLCSWLFLHWFLSDSMVRIVPMSYLWFVWICIFVMISLLKSLRECLISF